MIPLKDIQEVELVELLNFFISTKDASYNRAQPIVVLRSVFVTSDLGSDLSYLEGILKTLNFIDDNLFKDLSKISFIAAESNLSQIEAEIINPGVVEPLE